MNEVDLLNDFSEVRECDYKGEHYSVRDNGAIMRHSKAEKVRALDNVWTFGRKNAQNGYMYFAANVRVHIVVATAFYGAHDSKKLVVDHIDTNRCNNRANNLRWVTRLENALNNPVTRKRIEFLCGGDIQKFIDDPSCLRMGIGAFQDLSWMRTVSREEAKNAYENVMRWASYRPGPVDDVTRDIKAKSPKDQEWMFKPPKAAKESKPSPEILVQAQSPSSAVQKNWKTPSVFPCCPDVVSVESLHEYAERLKSGVKFSENQFGATIVDEAELTQDAMALVVRGTNTANEIKGGGVLTRVYIEDEKFVHESKGSFFTEGGAKKYYTLELGREWTGGEVFDDYC